MRFALTLRSRNRKTGPIPVSTSSASTCPHSCALRKRNGGCYAHGGPLSIFWKRVTKGDAGLTWKQFLRAIRALPASQLWRHNQAGDLPGRGDEIDATMLAELVAANKGRRGFTFTHKPLTRENATAIRTANEGGFTINLSADTLEEADSLARKAVGPVVVLRPAATAYNHTERTPGGRKIVICPATYRTDITCERCMMCAWPNRAFVIGFPVHGGEKRAAARVAFGFQS